MSRFRFRDHNQEMDNGDSIDGNSRLDSLSLSSNDEEFECELESMTAKGINRLCSELLELKQASDEDFQNIFSNYLSFIRVFEETGGVKDEVMQLKHHVTAQRQLVEDLMNGIYLKILSEETIDSVIQETEGDDRTTQNLFKSRTDDILETLDTLLSEHRYDEAFLIFEREPGTSKKMQLQEDHFPDVWMSYKSAISERRAMLADQLIIVAENPIVSAAELQKALVGLCRLGFDHHATRLLVKYYHSRIACGIHDLQSSKTFLHGLYIRDLAKFVSSMISQVARSFAVLYGETSPFSSELIQWASEETRVFAACFNKYVKSISEISGGLSTAVEAVQIDMSYYSLFETQNIMLKPCLLEHILPCMEDILQIHFDHFKKVIGIFTSGDVWVVGRYLVSGMLTGGSSSMVTEPQPEYCFLTNSGRKFVTMLQAIKEDIPSLVSIQMGSSILKRLMDLFTEYSFILERALTKEANGLVNSGLRINLAESLSQQVSVIANLSTLEHFFSSLIRNVFKDINQLKFEIDSHILSVQDTCSRLRAHFCKQFLHNIMSTEGDERLPPASCIGNQMDSNMLNDLMPSVPFQELRKVEKLAEDSDIEADWLMCLLTELVETIFDWVSSNGEMWKISEEKMTDQQYGRFAQFALDIQFLVEIASHRGYLTRNMINTSKDLVFRMKSTLVSAGLIHYRDVIDYERVTKAAIEALNKLEEMREAKWPSDEEIEDIEEEINECQSHSAGDSVEDEDTGSSSKDSFEAVEVSVSKDTLSVASSTEREIPAIEATAHNGNVDSKQEELDNSITVSTAEY